MRPRISATSLLALALAAIFASSAGASATVTRVAPNQTFQTITGIGAWSFFGDARAVKVDDKYFLGWTTPSGQVQVGEYDPDSGKTTQITLGPRMEQGDDHENPSLMVRADGRLMAFYSPHSGRIYPKNRKSQLYYRTTINPADISKWTAFKTIPTNTFDGHLGYTYPNPVPLANNKIFLTWRGGDWLPAVATWSGKAWSHARGMIYSPHPRRPYVKTAQGLNKTVLIGYNQDNPRQTKTNTYFARYVPGKGYFRANGTKIANPLTRFPSQRGDVVAWNGQNGRTWVLDVAEDKHGSPYVVYAAGDRFSEMNFYLARYVAGSWKRTKIVDSGFNGKTLVPPSYHYYPSAGASLDHKNPNVIYLSRAIGSNLDMQVETWSLKSAGNLTGGWNVTRNSPLNMNCFRPVGVLGGEVGDVAMMCGNYYSWLNFPTGIFLAQPKKAINPL
jgi:hypothetical protein